MPIHTFIEDMIHMALKPMTFAKQKRTSKYFYKFENAELFFLYTITVALCPVVFPGDKLVVEPMLLKFIIGR